MVDVLYRDIWNLTVRNRQANTVEVDYINRVIVKDGENFYNYQLFDPLNLKLPRYYKEFRLHWKTLQNMTQILLKNFG